MKLIVEEEGFTLYIRVIKGNLKFSKTVIMEEYGAGKEIADFFRDIGVFEDVIHIGGYFIK